MFTTLILGRLRAWLLYLETVRELEDLSDRQLTDLGIGRRRIREVARRWTRAAVAAEAPSAS
jgi:uncharacterized protein YjiS (DUF1127 family)